MSQVGRAAAEAARKVRVEATNRGWLPILGHAKITEPITGKIIGTEVVETKYGAKTALTLQAFDKIVVVNKTSRTKLEAAFGRSTSSWIGKRVRVEAAELEWNDGSTRPVVLITPIGKGA